MMCTAHRNVIMWCCLYSMGCFVKGHFDRSKISMQDPTFLSVIRFHPQCCAALLADCRQDAVTGLGGCLS